MQRKNKNRGIVTYLIIAAVLVLCMMFVIPNLTSSSSKYKYSDIMKYFDNYKVTEYTLDLGTGKLNMTLDDGQSLTYNVPNVSLFLDDTKDYRTEYNDKTGKELSLDYFKIKDNTWILSLLPTLLLLCLLNLT